MHVRPDLVGREAERTRIEDALLRARRGHGSILLVAGEAGMGKTRLLAEVAAGSRAVVLRGAAAQSGGVPYGPVVAALRSRLRARPDALAGCGPLRGHLAVLLPEIGEAAPVVDRLTLFEALRCAIAHLAGDGHVLVVLDDLQWSDEATLELLAALAESVADLPVLVAAAYRTDGLPRGHGIRRLRHALRRAGRLDEVALGPLDRAATAAVLAALLDGIPSPALARAVHVRTEGVPFFVEELAAALRSASLLRNGRRGLELAGGDAVPLPETVRDAVLLGMAELPAEARATAEVAAVAGERFDPDLVAALASADGLSELVERGLVVEDASGAARFRHGLARDALYADVPWLRRRALHRRIAEALEAGGAPSPAVATQWLGARDGARARDALLRAAADFEAVHAYRDAVATGRQALELWPEDEDPAARRDALADHARRAELAGELADAARAWSDLTAGFAAVGDRAAQADARRRLAAVEELRGDRDGAFASRRIAAELYRELGRLADAAVELLAMANQRRLSARHGEAVELATAAREAATAAGRTDLEVRARGLEGLATAKRGDYEHGLEIVRSALARALEHDLTAVAAELYQRLSVTLYDSADYRTAEKALDTALQLCRASPDASTEVACVSCMAYVLRERGEWGRAAALSRELIASGTAVFVAEGLLGAIHAYEGRLASARRLLAASLSVSSKVRHYNMAVDATAALARVAVAESGHDEARARCRNVLDLWEGSDDHHYAVGAIRWAAAYHGSQGDRAGVNACAEALARMASATGHADALAALAQAIAEAALLDGDPDTAADQLSRAVELHRGLDMPFERAQIELRAGVALARAGDREPALERLCDAYRTARKLGARPLAAEAAREVGALGESVAARLGVRAEADADAGGLSRREREVVGLVATGRTNREIAQELFLSRRTVDMHVRNILRKLSCRSRVEAAGRARDLGLVT